ncbi:uncharacterized protein LOC112184589 [Rosa chinensis]|uniref:uncharacterized protein LOC112184589 n=1 Tax=Rosa chinensis TaxID=74649 RepID=UPI001AD8DCE5|nr:uncharacterized protein LOC112184589 [Rosa chinensis]
MREQYARLRDYRRELQRVDPGTTIDIKCDYNNPEKKPVFRRMYICLGAFKNALDANNTSWVVGYAMVEMESKDSWIWILKLLVKDLDIDHEGAGWTFISDKKKGLKPAFELVVPAARIIFCARYLWTNFSKLFPGKVMKDQMWKCAKATTLSYFQKEMEEMKSLVQDAYNWLTEPERPPQHWSRAYFTTGSDYDILINNMCESFNSFILESRGKPPLTMFEEIRWKLMKRNQITRDKMEAYHGNICPKLRNILEKNKIKAAIDCIATFNGGDRAEVENIEGSKNVVNHSVRTCNCRRWDLTGIPCKYVVAAIYGRRENSDDYVASCYLKKTYLSIYNHLIQPRHLPPKEKKAAALSKKRKVNGEAGQGSENQSKKGKTGPLTANELRQKARERAEYQRSLVNGLLMLQKLCRDYVAMDYYEWNGMVFKCWNCGNDA